MSHRDGDLTQLGPSRRWLETIRSGIGGMGLIIFVVSLWAADSYQFNVVNYQVVHVKLLRLSAGNYPGIMVLVGWLALVLLLSRRLHERNTPSLRHDHSSIPESDEARTSERAPAENGTLHSIGDGNSAHRTAVLPSCWPLWLALPLAAYTLAGRQTPFAVSYLVIAGVGLTGFLAAVSLPSWSVRRWSNPAAVCSLLGIMLLLTVVHTRIQINFFEHFMLGHADIGHFTEELKNALLGRGLRSDSFSNTRLGWHFTPLLYVLAPGYALFPSPVYLMVVSAVVVQLPALVIYFFARRLSGSVMVGWLLAVAWILLPSTSRLIYTGTYGFQWTCAAMVLLSAMIAAGETGRWKTAMLLVVLLLLQKETTAAATLGWGLYVALFTPSRKLGWCVVILSGLYFLLVMKWIIPAFASTGRYERLDLYGELGRSVTDGLKALWTQPALIGSRLMRREVIHFAFIMLTPLLFLPIRKWRITLAALPTFVMIALLKNTDWLSIKFWHHCTVLPFLFFAGVTAVCDKRHGSALAAGANAESPSGDKGEEDTPKSGEVIMVRSRTPKTAWTEVRGSSDLPQGARLYALLTPLIRREGIDTAARQRAMAVALFLAAATAHFFYGFSPIAKAYGPYRAEKRLHQPDPRLVTVQRLRDTIPRDKDILATERLAAHFTDYHRLYTGKRDGAIETADFVIIDRADAWDQSGLVQQVDALSLNPHFRRYAQSGSIVVFMRIPDAPKKTLD